MSAIFEKLPKSKYQTKQSARLALTSLHPDLEIQAILDGGDSWVSRLNDPVGVSMRKRALDFSSPDDDEEDDLPEPPKNKGKGKKEDDDDFEEDKPKGKGKKSPKKLDDMPDMDDMDGEGDLGKGGNVKSKLKRLIGELQDLLDELPSGTSELNAEDGGMDELGPVPGGPAQHGLDTAPPIPRPPRPSRGFDARKRPSVGVPTFTNTKVVAVPLFTERGSRVSVAEAVEAIENQPRYAAYEVDRVQADEDSEKLVARLVLKSV